jgi:ABC-type phosphate transport system permease subunit
MNVVQTIYAMFLVFAVGMVCGLYISEWARRNKKEN